MDDGCFILDLTGYPLILSFDFEHFHSITHTSVSSKTFLSVIRESVIRPPVNILWENGGNPSQWAGVGLLVWIHLIKQALTIFHTYHTDIKSGGGVGGGGQCRHLWRHLPRERAQIWIILTRHHFMFQVKK